MAYIVLLFYIFIVYAITRNMLHNKKAELFFMCLGIFIFLGFRSISTGTDTPGYCETFIIYGRKYNTLKDILAIKTNEIGFRIYMLLLYKIAPFKQALLLSNALITTICYGVFIKRFSCDYFISTLIFLTFELNFYTTGMRQSLAMSLCQIAYIFLVERKYIKSLLLIILAYSFHNSAIVFILIFLYGVVWKKNNNIISTIITSLLFYLFADLVLNYASFISDKWKVYSIEYTGNGIIFFLVLIILEFVFYLSREKLDDENKFHVRVSYLSIIFWAGRLATRTFERPAMYFFSSFEAELPDAINKNDENNMKLVYLGLIILICILYIYRNIGNYYMLCF